MTTRILVGDARRRMKKIKDQSVHCIITSPPYWGLRAYHLHDWIGGDPKCNHEGKPLGRGVPKGKDAWERASRSMDVMPTSNVCVKCGAIKEEVSGGIGLEDTFQEHLDNLLEVFSEVWRVLRDDGTLWLNYGDRYASGASGAQSNHEYKVNKGSTKTAPVKEFGLKPKDLMLMPARVAMALQEQGWYLRSEIVWHKNGMPESVQDRPTTTHEKVFLFSKQPKYFYDAYAVQTERTEDSIARESRAYYGKVHTPPGQGDHRGKLFQPRHNQNKRPKKLKPMELGTGRRYEPGARIDGGHRMHGKRYAESWQGANLRNIWKISTASYRGAHFAVFPEELASIPIKAGTSEHGVCHICGSPYKRKIESSPFAVTWEQTCKCEGAKPVPAVVLDPFGGSGTVGMVADNLGRNSVIVEISDEYAKLAKKRIVRNSPLTARVKVYPSKAKS